LPCDGRERIVWRSYNLAVADFTLALKRDPKSAAAYAGRGTAYLRTGAVDQAAADFSKANRLDAKETTALEGKAYIARREGNVSQAIALFSLVLKIKPDETEVRAGLAQMLASDHRYDDALKEMTALIRKTPDNPVWLNSRCWYRAIADKELSDALLDCDASLKTKEAPNTRDSRRLVNLRLGKFDAAIADYDMALSQQPNVPSSLYRRGIAKIRKGAGTEGQADITAALAIDPKIEKRFADYGVTPRPGGLVGFRSEDLCFALPITSLTNAPI
jgi:tetratricopeptide (TPR) repeat protein